MRLAALALVVAGLACAFGALAIDAKAWLGQRLMLRAWAAVQADPRHAPVRPWPWADTYPVARLAAPAQHADVLVLAGATGRTLAWGPGHLDGTASPGERGLAVMSAHRDTHFAFLERVRIDDVLRVERPDGRRVDYRITGIRVVPASRVPAALAAVDDDARRLALVSCYPFGALAPGTPWRYVVTAAAD